MNQLIFIAYNGCADYLQVIYLVENMRPSGRQNYQIRPVLIETATIISAEGSCLIKCGNTHVMCSATIENTVPAFLRGQNQGWVTAEYSMLPRATSQRSRREVNQGKLSGRTQEIQRLIGRSLRAAVNLKALGERQIIIDCDVINADGGTRTSAITGSYVALALAVRSLIDRRIIKTSPLTAQIAAISCGLYKGQIIVDLDYLEDSNAEVDANFVFNSQGGIIEVQSSAEKSAFSEQQLTDMLKLAKDAAAGLFEYQRQILSVNLSSHN